jgi:hypothetical protein
VTDLEYNREKARIQKLLNKWRAAGFGWFRLTYSWLRETKDNNDLSAAAECSAQWEYKQAHITFYLPMFVGKTDEEVESIVVHELSHILTSPIQNFSDDDSRQMTEFSTSMVADALLWAAEFVKEKKK